MNYDALAAALFVVLVGGWLIYRAISRMILLTHQYYWMYSKTDVQEMLTKISQLENQVKWYQTYAELPDKQLPLFAPEKQPAIRQTKRGPYRFGDEYWFQIWNPRDWSQYTSEKTYVYRNGRCLWVDEPQSGDKIFTYRNGEYLWVTSLDSTRGKRVDESDVPWKWEFSHYAQNGTFKHMGLKDSKLLKSAPR